MRDFGGDLGCGDAGGGLRGEVQLDEYGLDGGSGLLDLLGDLVKLGERAGCED